MHDDPVLDRREFTRLSLLAMLSGVAITISGCGGGGGGNTPGGPTPPSNSDDERADISANHGHTAVISRAQLTAGGQLTLTLTPGVPAHVHIVSLTAAEVASIRDGARVSKLSSNDDAHDHMVTFN
jgi:hypothetical protein